MVEAVVWSIKYNLVPGVGRAHRDVFAEDRLQPVFQSNVHSAFTVLYPAISLHVSPVPAILQDQTRRLLSEEH